MLFTVDVRIIRRLHMEPDSPEYAEGSDDPDWQDHWHASKWVSNLRAVLTTGSDASTKRRTLYHIGDDLSDAAIDSLFARVGKELAAHYKREATDEIGAARNEQSADMNQGSLC